MKYFTFDYHGEGFKYHSTEEKAKNHAKQLLDYYIQNYDQDYVHICWGEIKEAVHTSDAVLELKAIKG